MSSQFSTSSGEGAWRWRVRSLACSCRNGIARPGHFPSYLEARAEAKGSARAFDESFSRCCWELRALQLDVRVTSDSAVQALASVRDWCGCKEAP